MYKRQTLTETKGSLVEFFEAFERGGFKGESGIIDTFFSKKNAKSIITPELMDDFEKFKDKFNNSTLSAEALAEKLKNVNSRIVEYAKTCKNGELTTEGFTKSLNQTTLGAKAGHVALKGLATAGNMFAMWVVSEVISLAANAIDDYIHAAEKAREQSSELTDKWKEENTSINNSISKYQELKEKLNDTSLTDVYKRQILMCMKAAMTS